MGNGQSELDKVGCEYGRKIKMENKFQNEILEDIKGTQKEILTELKEIRARQDKTQHLSMIGGTTIKYVIAGVVGGIISAISFIISSGSW